MRRESSEELARAARARLEALVRQWPPAAETLDPAVVPDDPGTVRPDEQQRGPRHGRHAAVLRGRGSVDRFAALVPEQRGRLLLALVVAVVAALIAGWSAWRSAPRPVPVAARSTPAVARTSGGVPVAASSGGPSPAVASGGVATATKVVVVDVSGKVRHPGIATLPAGARVVDALRRAGGARAGVDLSALNLARVLVDGEQILVGVAPPAGAAAPAGSAGRSGSAPPTGVLVNLNTATATDLEGLPGVGPVTAQKVIAWRTAHGSFTAIDELLEVPGIGPKTLAEIAPGVTL